MSLEADAVKAISKATAFFSLTAWPLQTRDIAYRYNLDLGYIMSSNLQFSCVVNYQYQITSPTSHYQTVFI